ncbi:ABC transporter ATP-binding protein [Stygiolobus caldivivus]|uniref:Multidrug ABC transporter ATP-binding protein n=1 Tax=Stygiolobus caldivivus TaxID=2824673 RepID=A0A8D5U640_9CREN|nr:ABC transporter ATP-binding protein [Stygiolobus caldivivus]BCU69546.1 multidrug ABC transporter ATP-binding protein [Stygiolobus caldivivus]
MSSEIAVSVTDVVKKFNSTVILKGISFEVFKEDVFGLIGPNGAGKTTTLRIIAGIIRRYEGKVSVFSYEPEKAKELGLISYMPEDAFPYERLTGLENLSLFAEIYAKGNKKLAEEYIEIGIRIADLGRKIYEKTATYSRGMKRRLIIARTLMTKPKLAILDEPTSALDVESSVRIRNVITDMSKKLGSTIILSSHNMLEVEYMCNRVAMINDGKIIQIGTPKEITDKLGVRNLEEAFLKVVSRDQSIPS